LNVAANDTEKRLLKYLITMEPPTYNYARYIDWVIPYLNDTILMASRTPNMHSSKVEMAVGNSVRIMLQ
jgi:hypothetical protein